MAEEFDDLISTLPTEILLHILSFLPDTRLCAKASTLSKRWRHLSSHCPVIRLPLPPSSAAEESPTAYITAVDGCLAAYRPTAVQSLEIHLPSSTLTYTVPYLWAHLPPADAAPDPWALASDRWMRWAGDRSVRHLRLTGQCYPSRGRKYAPDTAIPSSVFSPFLSLTSLHLSQCYFHSFPNSDDRFRVLKELTISDTLITNRGLGELLQCCPVLEILELHRCLWAENLKLDAKALTKLMHIRVRDCEGIEEARAEIKAPYLRFFSNDGDLSAIVVKDAPFLHEARLHGCPGKPFVSDKMALLSSSIALVESLSVDDWIFRVKFVRNDPSPAIFKIVVRSHPREAIFKNLKNLNCNVDWITEYMLCTFSSIFEECPSLVELHLKLHGNRKMVKYWLQYPDERVLSDFTIDEQFCYVLLQTAFKDDFEEGECGPSELLKDIGKSSHCLKQVVIEGYVGSENEVQLVWFLLRNATILERLVVIGFQCLDQKMVQSQLSQFRRIFPNVRIVQQLEN